MCERVKINEIVVCEGKYDKILLDSVLEAVIIPVSGFGIFKNKKLKKTLSDLAEKRGLLVITDSDSAGMVIRNHIKSFVSTKYIKHAYIPQIEGKEKRKRSPSAEKLLGVEGMKKDIIVNAIKNSGIKIDTNLSDNSFRDDNITVTDLFEIGLSGREDSSAKREKCFKYYNLPNNLSTKALIDILNIITTKTELYSVNWEEII